MPYARADHAMVKIDDKVFFIGGVGESNEKVMSYNLNYGNGTLIMPFSMILYMHLDLEFIMKI